MSTPGFVESWPHPFHRIADGQAVEVFQLRPDLVEQLRAWAGGEVVFVNDGPAVLLPGAGPAGGRLVGLGDFAVRDGATSQAEPGDGFYRRYQPAAPAATRPGG